MQFHLDVDLATVGRAQDNDIVLQELTVSSHHGEFVRQGDAYYYRDKQSSNGSKVNGLPTPGTILKPGDTLTLGGCSGILVQNQISSPQLPGHQPDGRTTLICSTGPNKIRYLVEQIEGGASTAITVFASAHEANARAQAKLFSAWATLPPCGLHIFLLKSVRTEKYRQFLLIKIGSLAAQWELTTALATDSFARLELEILTTEENMARSPAPCFENFAQPGCTLMPGGDFENIVQEMRRGEYAIVQSTDYDLFAAAASSNVVQHQSTGIPLALAKAFASAQKESRAVAVLNVSISDKMLFEAAEIGSYAVAVQRIFVCEHLGKPVVAWSAAEDGKNFDVGLARDILAMHLAPLGYELGRHSIGEDPGEAGNYCYFFELSETRNSEDLRQVNATSKQTSESDLQTPQDLTEFVAVPAGEFVMGDLNDRGEDAPPHLVHLGQFAIAKHLVTNALFDRVRIWAWANGYTDCFGGGTRTLSDYPVHSIDWMTSVVWCNARSEMEGLTPCYSTSGLVCRTASNALLECDWSADGYRLPTEAEWEKAARGGLSGMRYPWGNAISHNDANFSNGWICHPTYDRGDRPYTSPVGSFAANGYGLYDMAGNVEEWCWDWYGAYTSDTQRDPRGASSGQIRVRRGGSWSSHELYCRVACRQTRETQYVFRGQGFRLARNNCP